MVKYIKHIGTPRHSGRYPWGSGGDLLSRIENLKNAGLTEKEIAKSLDMSTTKLRNQKSLATSERKEEQRLKVIRERESGVSVAAISRDLSIPESTIRDLLKPNANKKFRVIRELADRIKGLITKGKYVDVGEGVEAHLGVTETKLANAVTLLTNEGYKKYYIDQPQLGTQDRKTRIKVLVGPDVEYTELSNNRMNIQIPNFIANDAGDGFYVPQPVKGISQDRILVKYANDGGGDKDGLIELRSGVPEFNLGESHYAQVRIGVGDTHYMKGMAVQVNDIPDGYDVIYNTNKLSTGNKLDAMKPQKEAGVSRFGAMVRPNTYLDSSGNTVPGVLNIVGDTTPNVEGSWDKWSKSLASQVLAKQPPKLAERQLKISQKNAEAELNDILSLTNPVVRKHLLTEFADSVDRKAIDLKAAALPGQRTHVMLPDPNLKLDEVYAPNYNNGDVISLVRFPHGGKFEIPTLRVNNKNSIYRDIIGPQAQDAIAIHPDVAQKMSGADFDGDTCLTIPNKTGALRTAPSLEKLKNFDPINAYPKFDGMKVISPERMQTEMGMISNLITDMSIKGASDSEIARAVKHSMVVIDSEKHKLNYKQSARDNSITALKRTYQTSPDRQGFGAATLLSRSNSQERVLQRVDRYAIDPKTGEKVYTNTNESYIHKKTGKVIERRTMSTKGAETKDAHKLSSGTVVEKVYADHANSLKALGNQARLATLDKKVTAYSREAYQKFKPQVQSLDTKLKEAIKAKPIERKAQILGSEIYKRKVESAPDMSRADKKKERGRSIALARVRLDASKPVIKITPREWTAIEMGAVSGTRLKALLQNADMDVVRGYATPRVAKAALSSGKKSRARSLVKAGYTSAEIAAALGVPVYQVREIND